MNAMDSPPQRQLLQQAEKVLLRPIHSHLVAYCPSMDLIALVTDEENLDVYRINGQRALGLKRKNEDVTVQALCWQWNGAGIAVAWSDGCVDVVSVETGKVVHRNVKVPFEGADEEGTRVGVIGWGLNFIDAEKVKRRTGELKMNDREYEGREEGGFRVDSTEDWDDFKDELSLEDFLQRQPDFSTLDIAPDLPDQLAMMDTESLLPKLPAIPLPPANPLMRFQRQAVDAGAFSTQVQVDGLLHSHHLRDYNGVDMFIRCTEKGSIYPSIYDSMETVDVRLPAAWGVKSKVLMHASHPYACTHSLLTQISSSSSGGDNQKKLAWVPLTLGFIPSAGNYLHLIASKTAQLQNLLSYLSHALTRIQAYFIQSQDLPGKFMRNISETLEEHKQGDLVQNLYHLACTGHCPQVIHDWLVDELAEQGHKRWDNATSSGLTLVIQILHENLLPALDRCSIIISRLRGLATYHDRDWIFSGPVSDFTALFGVLKTLRVLADTTLLYATDEKRYFTSFSKWLRYSIDFEATEPGSQSRTEMEARDPGVDVAVVLQYIEHGMANSDVAPYLQSAKAFEGVEPCEYEETLKAIELLREGAAYKPEALCVEKVLEQFGERVRGLLKQVSQWQENNITMDSGLVLEEGKDIQALDMRMVAEVCVHTHPSYTIYVLTNIPPDRPRYHINIRRSQKPLVSFLSEHPQPHPRPPHILTRLLPLLVRILDSPNIETHPPRGKICRRYNPPPSPTALLFENLLPRLPPICIYQTISSSILRPAPRPRAPLHTSPRRLRNVSHIAPHAYAFRRNPGSAYAACFRGPLHAPEARRQWAEGATRRGRAGQR